MTNNMDDLPLSIWTEGVCLLVVRSKKFRDHLKEVVEREVYGMEKHKQNAREHLGKDKEKFEFCMYMAKETKFNLNYIVNRMKFFDACANLDTPTVLKYHQECVEFEDDAVEKVFDTDIKIVSICAESNDIADGEGATLKICNSMKENREGREIFLQMIDMYERGREDYEPQLKSILGLCEE